MFKNRFLTVVDNPLFPISNLCFYHTSSLFKNVPPFLKCVLQGRVIEISPLWCSKLIRGNNWLSMCVGMINHSRLITLSTNRRQGRLLHCCAAASVGGQQLCCVSSAQSDKAAGRGAGSALQVSRPITWLERYRGHNDRARGGWPPWHAVGIFLFSFQPPPGRRREVPVLSAAHGLF